MEQEVAAVLDQPVLVGHSSGGVLALEALVADPSLSSAAVLCELPIVVDAPLGGESVERARAALAAGKPGTAFAIFLREVARMKSPMVAMAKFAMNRQGSCSKVNEARSTCATGSTRWPLCCLRRAASHSTAKATPLRQGRRGERHFRG